MLAVCNTTPLIYLAKVELLHVLKQLFDLVCIPEEVYQEAVPKGVAAGYKDAIAIEEACKDWIVRKQAEVELGSVLGSAAIPAQELKGLQARVLVMHKVDMATIALAVELDADVLIMDDRAPLRLALDIAPHFKYEVLGSGDVVDDALAKNIISVNEHTNFIDAFSSAAWVNSL